MDLNKGFTTGLHLTQTQTLSMRQLQSLSLLAMSSEELKAFMQNEYLENPMLEHNGGVYPEFDPGEIPDTNMDAVRELVVSQLIHKKFTGGEWQAILYMTECLDDSGYLPVSIDEISSATGLPARRLGQLLAMLKCLEPCGIFSRDLHESLLIQLEKNGMKDSTAYIIADRYLDELQSGRLSRITREMKLSTAEVRKCMEQIRALNPRPLSGIKHDRNDYTVPDVIFSKEDGEWEIFLNDCWIEDYHINDYYLQMMKDTKDRELKEYFTGRLERIRLIQEGIRRRRETIMRISEEILKRQKKFFEGEDKPVPMTMTEVAAALEMNPSTVSRTVKDKYIQTPVQTLPMREMFSISGTHYSEDGTDLQEASKKIIRDLIAKENREKPLSDQAITERLKEAGIDISRRTVAKYRDAMGIPPGSERKAAESVINDP